MTILTDITHRLTFSPSAYNHEKEVYYGFTNDRSRLMNKAVI